MSVSLMLLPALAQAAAPLVETGAVVPITGQGLNYWHLIMEASLPVKAVMLLLLFASVASWTIIFRKQKVLGAALEESESFEDRFWSGVALNELYQAASDRNRDVRGLESIFEAGFSEFGRLRAKRGVDSRTQLEGAQRAMRAQAAREIDDLDNNLEFLASVGSISPYVGLFGTVWGIMISFQSLANMKEATIATVAPGISEALIATAMGLFAAIPAVWAYNRFATKVERISVRYEAFAEEFSSILQRQAHLE